ncbi:4-hydroxy-4-methyl-2-oxoglutarate aldolase [Catalinimonas alkaloidigena]|uniref:RraA family protein n=1 Tax=Catalinimonas alkaloidigena TaxID=1075417 RepID=UPI0024063E57|nr:RraA family protein [Catalinimonas alkaloidigena]MDF9797992.1 4-hydroxy-4-methyl-2-oxoglutarate aldolase [Catalinimonas alkaloidigena]
MKRNYLIFFIFSGLLFFASPTVAQHVTLSKEEMMELTSDWEGERYPDGRPKVAQELLDRAKNISIEEAWGVLRNKGYNNQFDGGWEMLHQDQPFAGRALTAQYMPSRPDVAEDIEAQGEADGRIGGSNSWPIDELQMGDVYVADGFGKIVDGTLIGDNLGNSIYAKSGNGVVFDGSSRDLEGLSKIEGFNAYVRGWDPSFIKDMMLTGINTPIRIGRATVMPGDVVLAKREGVIFIPAHLAEEVITNAEFIALRDQFGHQMLREGTFTPGQIDSRWTDDIKEAFLGWLDDNPDMLPMSREELDEFLEGRVW